MTAPKIFGHNAYRAAKSDATANAKRNTETVANSKINATQTFRDALVESLSQTLKSFATRDETPWNQRLDAFYVDRESPFYEIAHTDHPLYPAILEAFKGIIESPEPQGFGLKLANHGAEAAHGNQVRFWIQVVPPNPSRNSSPNPFPNVFD